MNKGEAMSLRYLLAAGVAAAALSGGSAFAADADDNSVDELIITAQGLEQTLPLELSKYGNDLVIVDGQTIKNKIYIDTGSALQMEVPGLYFAQQAGPFSYAYVSLQGSRIQDILWTVDGVRVNNRLYNTTPPNDTLPAGMIERIEVLKGGESLFYGTQGVAGVINVVTRSFSKDFGGQVSGGGDSDGGWHVDGFVRGGVGGQRFVLFGSKDKSDGFKAYTAYQPSATDRERGYDVGNIGLKYGFDINDDLKLSATYLHTDAELDYPGARLTASSQNERYEDVLSGKLDYAPAMGIQFFIKAYHHTWDSHYTTINNVVGSPGVTTLVDDNLFWGYQDNGVNAVAKLPVGSFDVLGGYDYQAFKGRDEVLIINQQEEKVHGVFGQIRTNKALGDMVSAAAGFRYNKTGETEATVWNLSGRVDANANLYFEGNAGTGFSLPTAEHLFAVDPFSTFGNPFIKPERSQSYDLAVGGRFGMSSQWKLTGFDRKVDDLITFTTDLTLIPAQVQAHPDFASAGEAYINLGEANFSGFEALFATQITPGLTASASYTHTKAKAKGAATQLDRIPEDLAKAQLDWAPADSRWGGSATAIWTGDVSSNVSGFGRVNYGDYYVLDLAAYVSLDQAKKQRLTLRVQNVFDEDYATRANSGLIDGSASRFYFENRGTPRTFHLRYSYAFGG
ncbi:TonB-dependent receptor [soil metagenome]